jgi:hypothetical protein
MWWWPSIGRRKKGSALPPEPPRKEAPLEATYRAFRFHRLLLDLNISTGVGEAIGHLKIPTGGGY